ncbi:hypothetical protein ABH926_003242 [Catenulispora sp. GP43]|uniref:hypothetical protein n=1 Tax=Catenulispora sp. GP43 TaxID=3156263 RepID=UPI003517077B
MPIIVKLEGAMVRAIIDDLDGSAAGRVVLGYRLLSLHYEWMLSLRLPPDVPDAFVDELRFHLGLSGSAPRTPTLDYGYPVLGVDVDQDELPGAWIAGWYANSTATAPRPGECSCAPSSWTTRCIS